MRGIIATYQPAAAIGTITTPDGNAYVFALDDLTTPANVVLGQVVEFQADGSRATTIKAVEGAAGAVASAMLGFNFARTMFSFNGRLSRQDYWLGTLINASAQTIVGSIPILNILLWPLSLWPALAVSVKRLHDIGRSGWFVLIPVICFVGTLASIIIGVLNVYGVTDQTPATSFNSFTPYMIAAIVLFLIHIAFIIALGVIKGQIDHNKYGPPTGRP